MICSGVSPSASRESIATIRLPSSAGNKEAEVDCRTSESERMFASTWGSDEAARLPIHCGAMQAPAALRVRKELLPSASQLLRTVRAYAVAVARSNRSSH